MTAFLAGVCVSAALLFQTDVAVSDELAHLESLSRNPQQFVDAARRFDLQQQGLIAWDRRLAEGYSRRGQYSLVVAKEADVRRRTALIGEAWRIVLSHYPQNARAVNYYGEYLYDYAGRIDLAVQRWLIAIGLDSELPQPYNNLGIHYFHHGRIEKGLSNLHRALKLDPKNAEVHFNLAQMYLIYFPQLEEILRTSRPRIFRDAMTYSRNATRYAPDDYEILEDYAVNFYAAENFGVEADWSEATRAWKNARSHARNERELYYTWLNEGRIWIRLEEWSKAADSLEEAIQLLPESEAGRELLDQVRDEMSDL